jgi:hypothetical protein
VVLNLPAPLLHAATARLQGTEIKLLASLWERLDYGQRLLICKKLNFVVGFLTV